VEILHESAAKLGELKDQLESLVKFFSGIETTIDLMTSKRFWIQLSGTQHTKTNR
jgi:hypothetical protein